MSSSTTTLFVGGLTPQAASADPEVLKPIFEQYGEINTISIRGKQKSGSKKEILPYAFVAYRERHSAERALVGLAANMQRYSTCFTVVEVAAAARTSTDKAMSDTTSRRADDDKRKAQANRLSKLAETCNLIIQCPATHADRLAEYIADITTDGQHIVKGSHSHDRKGETLLFVHSSEKGSGPERLVTLLSETTYVSQIIKKLYMIGDSSKSKLIARLGTIETVAEEAKRLLIQFTKDISTNKEEIVVRISTFPPRIAPELVASIEDMQSTLTEDASSFVKMGATNESHVLSVIRFDGQMDDGKDIYLISVSDARLPKFGESMPDDKVCRAQRKIEEAFGRYRYGDAPQSLQLRPLKEELSGAVALDCGASPGGWTMYLAKEVNCSKVYSVDPGKLSNDVRSMENVQHLQMRIEEALGVISIEAGHNTIDLWVSDMCLHNFGENIDWLLKTKADGVLREEAYFIFTLKCVRSKAKSSINRQVKEEVRRLDGIASCVEILHLFSNRSGERTVVGRFKGT